MYGIFTGDFGRPMDNVFFLSATLVKEGYNLAEGNINKEVLKEEKKVRVYLDIIPGKRQVLKVFIYEGDSSEVKKNIFKTQRKSPNHIQLGTCGIFNLGYPEVFS